MIPVLVIANNRPDYLDRVLKSLEDYLPGCPVMVQNDWDHDGMARNVQAGWARMLTEYPDCEYVFHWEDDMVLTGTPPIQAMLDVMDEHQHLANMMLKRQPWNHIETACGDVIQAIQDSCTEFLQFPSHAQHNHIFSLNPGLIRREVLELGWPAGNEAAMTQHLLDMEYRFGAWGKPGDTPYLDHIGVERGPEWKL